MQREVHQICDLSVSTKSLKICKIRNDQLDFSVAATLHTCPL